MADSVIMPAKPGLVRRTMQAVAYAISGVGPETWMSPLQPLHPMAEQSKGRAFDYPVAFNLNYIPRAHEPLNFVKLKQLAENGIIRTLIQTRQDQMAALEYTIRVKQDEPGPKGVKNAKDAAKTTYASKIADIREFLKMPDKRLDWTQWLHQLMEQHYVYDGCVVYKRRTKGSQPYAWEIVDAATISIKIDADGRPHPPPPSPAYQQVLKGLPTSNYTASTDEGPQFTTGEMLYVAKNTRVDRAYGFPICAQILTYVETLLSRSQEQLAEFTVGNAPRGIMEAPPNMTADQITSLQNLWDSIFSGNIETRRLLWFMPNGSKYEPIKRDILTDAFDEWLVRVACFAFSISPAPFTKQMNRATAESAQEVAASEGLAPSRAFVARYINRLIEQEFGVPQLEFAWVEEDELDPSKKAVMDVAYMRASALTIDEVRDSLGKEGFGGACAEPLYATATGWVPADPVEAQALKPVPASPFGGAAPGKPGQGVKGKPGTATPNGKKPAPGAKPNAPAGPKVAKAAVASLYIHRPLLNAFELIAWAKAQGFAQTLGVEDMHVTQAYSRDHLDWNSLPQAGSHMVYAEGGPRSVEPLGEEGAIVLKFQNDDLQGRFNELMVAGMSHNYDSYQAHVTISYNGALINGKMLNDVQPYTGALLFGAEVWAQVDDDWQKLLVTKDATIDAYTDPETGLTFYDVTPGDEAIADPDPNPTDPIDVHALTPENDEEELAEPFLEIRPVLNPLLPKGVGKSAEAPFSRDGGRVTKYSDDEPRDERGRWTSGEGSSVQERRLDTRDFTQAGNDDREAINAKYVSWVREQNNDLTSVERVVVEKYTGNGYPPINNYLRNGSLPQSEQWLPGATQEDVKNLSNLVNRSTLPDNLTVFRGGDSSIGKDLKIGDIVTDKGFISTSVRSNVAISFAAELSTPNALMRSPPSVFQINLPKGQSGYFPKNQEESELILPHGSSFRVVGVQPNSKVYMTDNRVPYTVNLYTLEPTAHAVASKTVQIMGESVNRFGWNVGEVTVTHSRLNTAKYSESEARDERGRWTSGGGGSGKRELKPVSSRAFSGKQQALRSTPSKLETGALGEKVATAFLKDHGLADARALNLKTTNFPVDLVGDHELYEVKTGLVSNGTSAQQWRATIGQPGKAETAWLAKAGPQAKAAWNAQKAQAIMDRKTAAVKAFSKELGVKVRGKTIGVILNPDTKTADIHVMRGFHARVAWTSDYAKASYVGTFRYK